MRITFSFPRSSPVRTDPETAKVIAFAASVVGVPRITQRNCREFYRRIRMIQETESPELHFPVSSLTWTDIAENIGFCTDAAPIPRRKFDAMVGANGRRK